MNNKPKLKPGTWGSISISDGCNLVYSCQAMKPKRKQHTWGSIFRNALKRGDDHGYAAHLAEAWEKRQAKKQKK